MAQNTCLQDCGAEVAKNFTSWTLVAQNVTSWTLVAQNICFLDFGGTEYLLPGPGLGGTEYLPPGPGLGGPVKP